MFESPKNQHEPDISRWFGITGPISEEFPQQADLIQTEHLVDTLRSFGAFEDDQQLQHREKMLKTLELLFQEWLKEICEEMNVPEIVIENVGGRVLPFGSFLLKACTQDSDIDTLCIGPGFIEREHFFTRFYAKLKAQPEVKDIQVIEDAFVPVMKMTYDGIEFDIVFAQVPRKYVSEKLNLLDDKLLQGMDKRCVRSLNGYRVTEAILHLVPNVQNFQLALKAIKLWAKCRNIYSNALGFLGGVSWAILLARICQVYPNASVSTLVTKFFKVYSMWEWSIPVRLRRVEDHKYNLPFWDPRFNPGDRSHIMPIITPAYPQQNTSFNVSPSTFAIITDEISQGHTIVQEIQQCKATWSKLFETPNIFEKYQHFILLEASSATERQHHKWVGLVKSKIRHLVGYLEKSIQISLVHVHIHPFHSKRKDKEGHSTKWPIGLLIKKQSKTVDLSVIMQSFIQSVYTAAKSCKIYEEGMSLSAKCINRTKLCWKMPDGTSKKVFSPKPSVNHQTTATVSPPRKPPGDTGQPDPKKIKLTQHKEPAKTGPTLTPLMITTATEISCPPSEGTSPETPVRTEPDIPSKKFKLDQIHPTTELSDLLPCPLRPVTGFKRPIKLQLISKTA